MARILLVDDDAFIRAVFQDALENVGHEVALAEDGDEALQVFRTFAPDLVVTDLVMPNRGGLSLVRDLREADPHLPILVVSGGAGDGGPSFLRTAGTFPGVETLPKPVRPSALCELVAVLLRDAGSAA